MTADMEPREHPGWIGLFTTYRYPGALANGTRIRKSLNLPGDAHKVGDQGRVLGSMGHPRVGFGYFVEWDDRPMHAVFVEARKVEATDGR
jgi:hypothetical protein